MAGEGIHMVAGPGEDGMTARGALRRANGVSQRLIRKIIHGEGEGAGALYINGAPALFKDRVKAGDEIRLVFPAEETWIEPEDIPLSVLYEDDDILIADKPPGLVVHPTKGHRSGTLANAIVGHMQKRGESYRPRFISRLDMDTSGVLLIGKNSHAQNSLTRQNEAGRVEKIYTAVLDGRLEDQLPREGVIDLPIGLAQPGEPKRAVLHEADGGSPARTAYEVVEWRAGASQPLASTGLEQKAATAGGPAATAGKPAATAGLQAVAAGKPAATAGKPSSESLTVVRVWLITGRTHQIRVHFSHFSCPVLGDSLYGHPSPLIARQALHAAEIAFTHPSSGLELRTTAPLPADIATALG